VSMLYIFFTSLHLFANYSAVTAVRMETFNQARLHLVVDSCLRQSSGAGRGHQGNTSTPYTHVMSVRQTNILEPVLWKTRRRLQISLGCSLVKLNNLYVNIMDLLSVYQNSPYLLSIDLQRGQVNIALHEDAVYRDQLQACYHAEILEFCYDASSRHSFSNIDDSVLHSIISAFKSRDTLLIIGQSLKYVQSNWSEFQKTVESIGWKTDPVQLCADEWRSQWNLYGGDFKKRLN